MGAAEGHPARQPEVPIEPRVQERAAIRLDPELAVAGASRVGAGLDAQVGAVGVCPDNSEGGVRPSAATAAAGPGHDGPGPPQVAAATIFVGPCPSVVQLHESGGVEALGHHLHGMEGRGGGVDEGQEVARRWSGGGCRVGHGSRSDVRSTAPTCIRW